MLIVGLAQLLSGNFHQIGAANAEVEPLVSDGAMNVHLYGIQEGTALPAVVIGGESKDTVGKAVN
jgi:hypothetical protein